MKQYKKMETETEKEKCNQHKEPISLRNIDINKITVSKEVPFGKKEFKFFYNNAKKKSIFMYISSKNYSV